MRLVITITLVILATAAGWLFYPELYTAISGKEAPLSQKANEEKKADEEEAASPDSTGNTEETKDAGESAAA